jgi:hypothetical protein
MTGTINDIRFRYTPRWGTMIACAIFFGICAFSIRAKAQTNDRGLIINGIIELSASGATTFYWILAWLAFGFVVAAVLMLVVRILNPQELVLTEGGLYAPKWAWSREPTFIRYQDILNVSSSTVGRQQFLKIVYIGGKRTITASLLESQYAFKEFCHELSRRIQACGRQAAT